MLGLKARLGMRALVCAAAISAGFTGVAQAASFTNGSFESASANPGSSFVTLAAGSTAINGWTVGASSIDYIGPYWQAEDGVRSIDLSGNAPGSISQTFDTDIGVEYLVSFWLAGNPDGGDSAKLTITSATGNPDQQSVFTVVPGTNTRANMGWQQFFYSFTATSASTTLAFASGETDAYGPALDNVSVAAVPEPASWAMLISGFGAIGAAMRRRQPRRLQAI